jgi:hypothetical protein
VSPLLRPQTNTSPGPEKRSHVTRANDHSASATGIRKLIVEQPYVNIVNVIPEPSTFGMIATGVGLAAYWRRKKEKERVGPSREQQKQQKTGKSAAKRIDVW